MGHILRHVLQGAAGLARNKPVDRAGKSPSSIFYLSDSGPKSDFLEP